MTVSTPAGPVSQDDPRPVRTPLPEQRRPVVHGRPRSAEADEAYERSAKEQAAIDIAAGW
jgi:hypothetical protein